MKHLTHYYIGMLLAGALGFLAACSSDEELLTPSGEDANFFLPKEDDHSAEAELRRDFFDATGVYLFFNDTLRHEYVGESADGYPVYETEMLEMGWIPLSSNTSIDLGFEYIIVEERQ